MLKNAAIFAGSVALLIAVPVLANKSTGQTTSHVQAVRSCLQDATNRLQQDSELARVQYLMRLEELKKIQKDDVKAAWALRETAIKAGRVTISKNNRRGQVVQDLKAEKKAFDAAKARAEAAYEAAKKAAIVRRQGEAQAARNSWVAARAAARTGYLEAKELCKK